MTYLLKIEIFISFIFRDLKDAGRSTQKIVAFTYNLQTNFKLLYFIIFMTE